MTHVLFLSTGAVIFLCVPCTYARLRALSRPFVLHNNILYYKYIPIVLCEPTHNMIVISVITIRVYVWLVFPLYTVCTLIECVAYVGIMV